MTIPSAKEIDGAAGCVLMTTRPLLTALKRANSTDGRNLHDACRAGRAAEVKYLLQHRADVNAREVDDGATPLCVACEAGQLEVVQILSSYGARRAHVRESAGGLFAEEAADQHDAVRSWLQSSRSW